MQGMKACVLFFLYVISVWAQGIPGAQFFQIKEYLQLTDAQYLDMLRSNDELNRRLSESSRRLYALQQEIAAEGEKEAPDPMEIGSRYVEITRVCRELRTQYEGQVSRNVGTLTDAQKTRLRALEELAKQFAVVSEAQGFRLMGDVAAPPQLGAPLLVYRVITTTSTAIGLPGCPSR